MTVIKAPRSANGSVPSLTETQALARRIRNRERQSRPPGLVEIDRLCDMILALGADVPWAVDFVRRNVGYSQRRPERI